MRLLLEPVDVPTAAEMLGISQTRVRQLISNHQLPAYRIGHVWAIPYSYVASRSEKKFPTCRPYKAKKAWQLINSHTVDLLDGVRYQKRGHLSRCNIGGDVPNGIVSELGGMLSGLAAGLEWAQSITQDYDVDVPELGFEHDFYIPVSKYSDFVDLTSIQVGNEGTTVIRFVDDDVWSLATSCSVSSKQYPGVMLATLAAVALDLMSGSSARGHDLASSLMLHKRPIFDAA